MTDIRALYPDAFDDHYYVGGDYQHMLDDFGAIVLQVDDDDYQGDSRLIYRDGERYGWLQFGWGSCSGCDALQACRSYEDLEALRTQLHDQIRWFDSLDALQAFFRAHDWVGDYSYHEAAQERFVQQVLALTR
jgi:hypothetical protein